MIFSWHKEVWSRLTAPNPRRLHAFLLHGRAGTGKRRLAEAFAAWQLCETGSGQRPCGSCDACRWLEQGSHPDLRVLEPQANAEDTSRDGEGASRASKRPRQHITIDQVRGLADFLTVSPHRGRAKVVLVVPAETLNAHAANALLKSLEEPAPDTVFLLVAHRVRQLPATIISRCVQVPLPLPSRAESVAWLAQRGSKNAADLLADAGGAPLLAEAQADAERTKQRQVVLRLLSDPAVIDPPRDGAALERMELVDVVDWYQKWCCDLMNARMRAPVRYNPGMAARIDQLAAGSDPLALATHWQDTMELRRLARHPLNPRLYCEDLLARYCRVFLAA
jgi:DNA polymerase-3 subunit delta'